MIEQEREEMESRVGELSRLKPQNAKLEKKVKRFIEEMTFVRSDLEKLKTEVSENYNSCGKMHKNQLEDIEMIQGVV